MLFNYTYWIIRGYIMTSLLCYIPHMLLKVENIEAYFLLSISYKFRCSNY